MSDLRKAAEMALEVMEYNRANGTPNMGAAIEALRQALAQPDDFVYSEDKSYRVSPATGSFGIGDTSAKREWVGLTDEEAREISFNLPIKWTGHLQGAASIYDFARAIEAKLKEKNT